MAANTLIQILRSNTTSIPGALANGQLAYTSNGNVLYIGSPDGTVTPIGGKYFPGTLTANQALVANSTSGINNINVGQITLVGPTQTISTGGSTGTAGYVLFSNGTSNVYWSSAGGLGVNTAAAYTWSNTQTFTNTISFSTNLIIGAAATAGANVTVGNSTVNTTVNATSFSGTSNNALSLGGTLAASYQLNSTLAANVATMSANNAAYLGTVAAASYQLNSTLAANVATLPANSASYIGTLPAASVANTSAPILATANIGTIYIGTNTSITSSVYTSGNSTVYSTANSVADAWVISNTTVNTSVVANAYALFFGNSTVSATINSTSYTGAANSAAYLGASLASAYQLNSTLAANVATLSANNAAYLGTVAAASYQLNSTLAANVATMTANNATNLNGIAQANFVQNTDSRTLSGNLTFSSTNTVFSSNVTITGANVQATAATLNVLNLNVTGAMSVSGTTTTINTTQLAVSDHVIQLGDGNLNTDVTDLGWYAPAGNTTTTWYSGFGRVAALSTNANPYFVAFATKTNPNTAGTFDLSAANAQYGTIQAYLSPYGAGGGFIANSSVLNITANSTFSSTISANTLTISNALLATSGGTGVAGASYAAGDILYAASAAPTALTRLTAAANGNVMQIVNNLPAWGALDGGSF